MSDTECPHGMDSPEWCSICKHGVTKPAEWEETTWYRAKFESQCPLCDLPISEGDDIVMQQKGADRTRWVHIGCSGGFKL